MPWRSRSGNAGKLLNWFWPIPMTFVRDPAQVLVREPAPVGRAGDVAPGAGDARVRVGERVGDRRRDAVDHVGAAAEQAVAEDERVERRAAGVEHAARHRHPERRVHGAVLHREVVRVDAVLWRAGVVRHRGEEERALEGACDRAARCARSGCCSRWSVVLVTVKSCVPGTASWPSIHAYAVSRMAVIWRVSWLWLCTWKSNASWRSCDVHAELSAGGRAPAARSAIRRSRIAGMSVSRLSRSAANAGSAWIERAVGDGAARGSRRCSGRRA